jgi:hypothetical protein
LLLDGEARSRPRLISIVADGQFADSSGGCSLSPLFSGERVRVRGSGKCCGAWLPFTPTLSP